MSHHVYRDALHGLEGRARVEGLLAWIKENVSTHSTQALAAARVLFEASTPGSKDRQWAQHWIAHALYFSGEIESAMGLARELLEKEPPEPLELRFLLGSALRKLMQYEEAEVTLLEVWEQTLGTELHDLGSRTQNILGLLFTSQSRFEEALGAYHKSLEALEALEFSDGIRFSVAVIHNNMGLIHREQNEHARAIQEYELALDGLRATPERRGEGTVLLNIGYCQKSLGDLDAAMRSFDEAAACFVRGGRDEELRLLDRVRAEALLARGEPEAARVLLEALLEVWTGPEDAISRVRALNALAPALAMLGDAPGALTCFEEAMALAQEIEHRESQLRNAEARVSFHEARAEFQEALAWQRRAHELERDQIDEVRASQMARMEARHELEARRREVARSKELARELERQVAERTEELLTARDMAQAASRAKSSFLAVTSHELRTPLNAVIGYTEMVLEELEEAPQTWGPRVGCVEDLSHARSSALHLLSQVEKILQLASLEAGGLTPVLRRLPTRALLLEMFESLDAVRTNQEAVDFVIDLRDVSDDARTETDAQLLRSVLFHLLENALKFTERGAVRLRAWGEGGALVVQVDDTGIGVGEDVLRSLPEPFALRDGSPTRMYEGLGLGLTLCQRYSALLGGALTLIETDAPGTTFEVRVPGHEKAPS